MTVTLADVAHAAGVSPATASRVLSESSYGVTSGRRARVQQAAEALGYIPNAHARALASSSTTTVGLVVHDVGDPYFAEIVKGVFRVADEAGRLVLLCNTFRDPDKELRYVAALRAQRVEAIIFAGSGGTGGSDYDSLGRRTRPFVEGGGQVVCIGGRLAGGDAVIPETVEGGRQAGEALADLGHQVIGVLTGPRQLTAVRDRLAGIRRGLRGRGVSLPAERVAVCDFTREGAIAAVPRLVDQVPELTAIIALNDGMAFGALAALRQAGVAVPDEVSVVGFDDVPQSRDVVPPLSTVRVPMAAMGETAMRLVLDRRPGPPREHRMPTQLVLRGTTAPPPSRPGLTGEGQT